MHVIQSRLSGSPLLFHTHIWEVNHILCCIDYEMMNIKPCNRLMITWHRQGIQLFIKTLNIVWIMKYRDSHITVAVSSAFRQRCVYNSCIQQTGSVKLFIVTNVFSVSFNTISNIGVNCGRQTSPSQSQINEFSFVCKRDKQSCT